MNIAILCEKLHTLPNDGGLLDQEERTVNRLVAIYGHLDEWREMEMKKASTPTKDNN